jgi:hypothetical protein
VPAIVRLETAMVLSKRLDQPVKAVIALVDDIPPNVFPRSLGVCVLIKSENQDLFQ